MQFIILAALVSTAKTFPAVPNLPVNETRKNYHANQLGARSAICYYIVAG
jgi:hypothetical protein